MTKTSKRGGISATDGKAFTAYVSSGDAKVSSGQRYGWVAYITALVLMEVITLIIVVVDALLRDTHHISFTCKVKDL